MRTRVPVTRGWEEGSPRWAVVGAPERPLARHEGSEKASQGRRVPHLLLMSTGQGEGGGREVCSRQRKWHVLKARGGERQADCAARGATHRHTRQTHQHSRAHTRTHTFRAADVGKKQHSERDENSYSRSLHELPLEWVVAGWFPWQLSASFPKTLQG